MRIPHVHKFHLENAEKAPKSIVEVDIQPEEYLDDIGLFEDKKEYVQWIKQFKSLLRNSYEYKELVYFLKRKRGMDRCGVHQNLTIWDGFRIEAHHTPFTLEDIISVVTSKRIKTNQTLNMSDIGREIMELHYLGLCGLYSLCMVCHSYAHSQDGDDLFIPLDNVFGDPAKFYDMYKKYVPDGVRTKFENILFLNKGYSLIKAELPPALQRHYIYVKPKKDNEMGLEVVSTKKLAGFIHELSTT